MRLETKTLPLADVRLELKADEGQPITVVGHASVFHGVDSYNDTILPGAYIKTISDWSQRQYAMPMLLNHSPDQILGKWELMREDERGLHVAGTLTPGADLSRNIACHLKHGALSGLSIGFRTKDAEQDKSGRRYLREIELLEISVVSHPADQYARVGGIKAMADQIDTLRDFEKFLREHGWSRREAEAISAGGFKAWLTAREEPQPETPPPASSERRDDGNEGSRALAAALAELRGFRPTLSQ